MLSILEVTRGGYLGPLNSSQAEYLRRLDRRARTMLAMVNELMTLSKRRSHEGIDLDGATDPVALARRVRRTFQDEAAGKNILFNLSLAENLAPIRGSLEVIEQLLENLISNALKYTPAGGKVTVNLKPGAGMAVIEVSDTGIGIPPAEKSKLFTEFFRASNAKSVEEIGTGLGLAIVKEIVDGLGGRILVESEEKMGSVFVIYLPLARAGPEPDAAAG
jgi:signal transduction histidine kinase